MLFLQIVLGFLFLAFLPVFVIIAVILYRRAAYYLDAWFFELVTDWKLKHGKEIT